MTLARKRAAFPAPPGLLVEPGGRAPSVTSNSCITGYAVRNLARRLEQMAPGVSASILEGIDELLTVIRLGLPIELRRSLACTNIIENMMGSIRRVCRKAISSP